MFGIRALKLRAIAGLLALHCAISWPAEPPRHSKVATLDEVIASGHDLWGEAAMAQPNGASYEFFEPLLAPLRYVHADFRYYPLVLSAPRAKTKARLISNGSGVNLRGGSRSWKEVGTPIVFRVGPDEFRFGDLRERVSIPELAEGWLPIYSITYRHPSPSGPESLTPIDQQPTKKEPETYRLEAFVSTEEPIAENAVVFVQFSLIAGKQGQVAVNVDPPGDSQFAKGAIKNEADETVALLDTTWKWERQGAHAALTPGKTATLAIITKPLAENALSFDAKTYGQHRERTVRHWKDIIGRAMNVELPEPRLNHAWKNLLAQNFMLANGDRMLYSAGNQYEAMYEMEGSDTVLAFLAWSYADDARELFVPLLDFTRKGLEAHQAGQKINDIVRYWWQTRDTPWVKEMRPRLEREFDRIVSNRDSATGLLPKERYCGDIATPVNSLSVEAKIVRALRDLPPVLRGVGDAQFADRVAKAEAEIRPKILDAVMKSIRNDVSPPFIPIALLDKESIHDPITATRIGSYWNLVINYVIGSRIFPPGSAEEKWIPEYLQTHGGLCMGMIRAGGAQNNFWTGPDRMNPLYGTRYSLDTLRRDDPERALVSLYGMLAHGFTRNTLVAAEGNTLAPVDDGGRFFYCPPNSAGNAHFLSILRNLLVQDWDLDDDGEPETLRLLYGISRRWLEDGRQIVVDRAPTAFGPVSVRAESHLNAGQVIVNADLPSRNPAKRTLLRARIPDGWRVTGAQIGGKTLGVDADGSVDLSGQTGPVTVTFAVSK